MKNFLLIIVLSIALINCKYENNDANSYAFIGGEIVNPNTKYVVLTKDEEVIDTVLLDSNNRFLYKIENLKSGLYTFTHSPENQIVLLEPGDSLHFRLNTMEFDESLVFTGKGAKKNNYLVELFLENEVEREKMLSYSQLSPIEFNDKIETTTKAKHERLKNFERKNSTSEIFNEIADANIHYSYYANKEIYPFAYYGNNELKNLRSLPKDFYKYREKVDYNNENLSAYYPYYRFLNLHFNNVAMDLHFRHSADSIYDKNSLDYHLDRLFVIDSLVKSDAIKNIHLKHTVLRFMYSTNSSEDIKTLMTAYNTKNTNKDYKAEVEYHAQSILKLPQGSELPDVQLQSFNDEVLNLSSLIKQPTVIHFWASERRYHFKESHLKVQTLKEKYPDLNFISIHSRHIGAANWKSILKQSNFPLNSEFRFVDAKIGRETLGVSTFYKVMLIDADRTIIAAHTNLLDPHFEEQLLGLLNQ